MRYDEDMEEKKKEILEKLILPALILVILAAVFLRPWDYSHRVEPFDTVPDKSDEILGYKSAEIREIIAGENREKQELIVYEQDFSSSMDITDMFLNIPWFRKTQTVHMYGTASYSVDLSRVTKDMIAVSQQERKITVTIPHAVLRDVTVDYAKTTFDEIDRGIFGWGDIKLTPEQQNEVEKKLHDALFNEASGKYYMTAADESALRQIEALYRGILDKLTWGVEMKIVFTG